MQLKWLLLIWSDFSVELAFLFSPTAKGPLMLSFFAFWVRPSLDQLALQDIVDLHASSKQRANVFLSVLATSSVLESSSNCAGTTDQIYIYPNEKTFSGVFCPLPTSVSLQAVTLFTSCLIRNVLSTST